MLERVRTTLSQPMSSLGTVRTRPYVLLYSIRSAIMPWIAVLLTSLFLLIAMPPARDALLHRVFPEQNFFQKFVSGNSHENSRDNAAKWLATLAWAVAGCGILTFFWVDLPRGVERATRRSRRAEVLADEIARRSVVDSLRLYRSALRLAIEHDRIAALESRIQSLGSLGPPAGQEGVIADRYRSLGVTSRGGNGMVHRAIDLTLGRTVALKELATTVIGEEDRARFHQEAQALAQLRHTNIVQVYDLFEHEGGMWIAMEFVEGGNLDEYITEKGRLESDEVVRFADGIADAMEFAHDHGIIHRDLKAMNVLLTESLQPMVADFGTAKLSSSSLQTLDGIIMGSPHTMSPEQVSGEPVDERSDVYSLGIVMYEMLLGRPPFTGEVAAVVTQHLYSAPPPVDQQDDSPKMPQPLASLVMQMLAKDPQERPGGMGAVREALSRMVTKQPVVT